jgi:hypothetical protein
LFDRAVRLCVTCAVATVPAVHSYGPAQTGGHTPTIVTTLSLPHGTYPFESGGLPELPHPPLEGFTTYGEIATTVGTARTTHPLA